MTITTSASASAATAGGEVGEPAELRRALDEIDRLGWDSPPGDAVLGYAYAHVVKVAVRRAGLTGVRAGDAASTGWAAAWRMLNQPDLRYQRSPWGLVTAAVRREVTNDQLGAAYRTNTRRAWRLARLHHARTDTAAAATGTGRGAPADLGADADWLRGLSPAVTGCPLSLDRLTEHGWEPAAGSGTGAEELGPRLTQVVDALTRAGWPATVAACSVAWIASAASAAAESRIAVTAELPGWRELAERTGLPTWRTRRLAALLLGYRDVPGVIARMVRDGDGVLQSPDAQRDLRSTVHRWLPSPCATATTTVSRRPDRVAA